VLPALKMQNFSCRPDFYSFVYSSVYSSCVANRADDELLFIVQISIGFENADVDGAKMPSNL
jgi:hypothetical protein